MVGKNAGAMRSLPGETLPQSPTVALQGPLRLLARTAPTIGDGLVALLRFLPASFGIDFRLEPRARRSLLHFHPIQARGTAFDSIAEESAQASHKMLKYLLGEGFCPRELHFRHRPCNSQDDSQSFFLCPALFEKEHSAFVLRTVDLDLPSDEADEVLHDIARFYLEAHCAPQDGLCLQLQRHIVSLLPKNRCTLGEVGRLVGLHPRTLQRRLADIGLDFEEQVDQIRRLQATQMLRETTLSVMQIATELGYRRTTSFCRAHHRWFNMTPLEHRLAEQARFSVAIV
jgi:AraC-like DNA-binding protein